MANPKQSKTVYIETLNDELCIYEWERKEVHALNPTAAQVWEMCDGQTSPAQMAARLCSELQTDLGQSQAKALVCSCLEQLHQAHLLEGETVESAGRPLLTRRQLLKAGVAVALLPVISSIVAPRPVEAQSPGATNIVLFDAGGTYNGNLGGRAGADALCQASANRPAGYANVRAFLSVDVNDEIRDMPANYSVPTNLPIVGPNGTQLAPDWTGLLDGNIDTMLVTADVLGAGVYWWSGSDTSADGSCYGTCGVGQACTNWTSSLGLERGRIGGSSATNYAWMSVANIVCSLARSVLCVAY